MNDKEIFKDYGFFSIEPKSNDSYLALIKIPGQKDKKVYNYPSRKMQVVPINHNLALISTSFSNIFIKRGENGGITSVELSFYDEAPSSIYDEGYNTSIVVEPPIQIETAPYKMTDNLLSQGLIVLKFGTEYVLYDFIHNKVISEGFSNISEVDGKLIAEYCVYGSYDNFDNICSRVVYPIDILVGELAYDGSLIGNRLESKKWNTIIQFQEGESISSKVYTYNSVLLCFNDTEPEFDYREYLADKGRV